MALEYFKYNTGYTNTLVERSNISFAPLVPPYKQIYADYFIPTTQPLYYYRESAGSIVLNSEANINNYLEGTAAPPTPEENVPYYEFTGYTATNDAKINNLISSFSGKSTGYTYNNYEFNAYAVGNLTLTNQTLVEQFLGNNNRNIRLIDLTYAEQIRISTRVVTASASVNSPRIVIKYANTFSTTVGNYANIGVTEVSAPLSPVGAINTGWVNVVGAAKGNVYVTITQIGGDGAADPALGGVSIEVKNSLVTAPVTLTGITQQDFNTYTGTTAPNTYVNKTAFNTYSGTTIPNTYYNKTQINSYSASTLTNINSRLLKTDFNTWSGTTLPANYYNKTQINVYTGATLTNINSRLITSTFNTWSGTTLPNIYLSKTAFNIYSGTTLTNINSRLLSSSFNSYSGTTLTNINSRLLTSAFNTWSGTTLPANYYNKTQINSYTGATNTTISNKLNTSIYSTYTGTTAPNQFASKAFVSNYTGVTAPNTYLGKTAFATYSGTTIPNTYYNKTQINNYTGATATAIGLKLNTSTFSTYTGTTLTNINNRLLTTTFNTWSGTTLPANYYNKTQINAYTGATLTNINSRLLSSSFNSYSGATLTNINNRLLTTTFNTWSGTTLPNTYLKRTTFATYTGTTAPNQFANKVNAITGATNLGGGNAIYTSVSGNKLQLKSISGGTGILISSIGNTINICSTASAPTWGSITGTLSNQTDLNNALNLKANITSPTFLVSACAPTATVNNNSTCIATTAFVLGQVGTANPLMNGTVAVGTSLLYSRQDHVHASDTSRLALAGGTMTGALIVNSTISSNNSITGTIICGSTCVQSPITCGTTRIQSPIVCGSTCVAAPITCGTTCLTTPISCGSTCVISPITIGSTCVCSPVVLGSTSICSPTVCSSTCLCAAGTTRLVGATTAASTLNVSGNTLTKGKVFIGKDLIVSGQTYLSGVTEYVPAISYGTPRPTPLPQISGTYTSIMILGTGGPNLSNVTQWGFTWSTTLVTNSFSTSNGVPAYFVNLLPLTTHTLGSPNPSLTLTGTGIAGLDGAYWMNVIDGGIIFVSKLSSFAIYLTNSGSVYIPPDFTSKYIGVQGDKKLISTGIKPHLYGTEFQLVESISASTSSSTSTQNKVVMTTTDLPEGRYKIFAKWRFSHNSVNSSARFELTVNDTSVGTQTPMSVEPKDTTNITSLTVTSYQILSGVKTIRLQYWNEAGSTTISDASIELIRVN